MDSGTFQSSYTLSSNLLEWKPAMNLSNSYFEIPSPMLLLDRWLNAYRHQDYAILQGKRVDVSWTSRAEKALVSRREPLLIEMQLYFSCVIKKRVVFHNSTDFETVAVNDKIKVGYRAVQSAVCDPETFARDYPQDRKLDSKAAMKMQPSKLNIDFKQGQWLGEISYNSNHI